MSASERPCAPLRDLTMPALDGLHVPVDVFIRDDDAGWNDAQLLSLLDLTQRCAVPIDLAAIPQAMSRGLARELRKRCDAAHGAVGVHQHGRTHLNHEAEGRKCEFGSARSAEQQRDDLMRGQAQLREHFGDLLQPIFTPPWNRCSELTPVLLAEIGFAALSRDRGARPVQGALQEIPVDINWTRHWREGGAPGVAAAFNRAFSERAADGQALGLMLHHAVMNQDEFSLLMQWLGVLSAHPHVRWRSMRELLERPG
jgi:hypothetical protein